MATDSVNGVGAQLNNAKVTQGASTDTTSAVKKANGTLGKDEFLQLLVTQLKNQDPMEPMKSEEFAVNLAQFSQLEQLMSINQKIDKTTTDGGMSLTSYLGHKVVFENSNLEVNGGDGGGVRVQLGSAVNNLSVEILGADGSAVKKVEAGKLDAGRHTIDLQGLDLPNGSYGFRVVAEGLSGDSTEVKGKVVGSVTGYVPGADPQLLIGNREIAPANISEVLAG